jgi:hypothetical protein
MIKDNKGIFTAASELYHRLVETKEIDAREAKAGASLLSVMQKSLMIDYFKHKEDIGELSIEQPKKIEPSNSSFVKRP